MSADDGAAPPRVKAREPKGDATARPRVEPSYRRIAEDALAQRDARVSYSDVLRDLPLTVSVLDRNWTILYLNRAMGQPPEELIGRCVLDFLQPEERAGRVEVFSRAWTTGKREELTGRSVNGFVWETHVIPVQRDGETTHLILSANDVTERVRAEEAVRLNEMRQRHAIEGASMGTWSRDESGVRWDERLAAIFGIGADETPFEPDGFVKFVHPDDVEFVRQRIARFRETLVYEDIEFRIIRRDGVVRHLISKGQIIVSKVDGQIHSYGGVFDVTKERDLEQKLRQAQRMEAMGQLTAGIAHNFNNILAIILPNAELCQRSALAADPGFAALSPRLDAIKHAAVRGADMIRELMLFASQQSGGSGLVSGREDIDLEASLRRTIEVCRTSFDRSITIDLRLPDEVPHVRATASGVEQVILNILMNARDAFEESNQPHPRIEVVVETRRTIGRVWITVTDNGPGMDEATRARVFEPFFTTKRHRRGTGLGLATAQVMITEFGGGMVCRSTLGEGTSFEIELASVDNFEPKSSRSGAARGRSPAETTILLVDDEPVFRKTLRAVLEAEQYNVREAGTVRECFEALSDAQPGVAPIDLVVLDHALPVEAGASVLQRITTAHPSVPVVVLSGRTLDGEGRGASATLRKPARIEDVLRTLRNVLEKRGVLEKRATRR